jgi:hypothetical protein
MSRQFRHGLTEPYCLYAAQNAPKPKSTRLAGLPASESFAAAVGILIATVLAINPAIEGSTNHVA